MSYSAIRRVPVTYYHDSVGKHMPEHMHTHTVADNNEHVFKSQMCRSEIWAGLGWAVLLAMLGSLYASLAVGWYTEQKSNSPSG